MSDAVNPDKLTCPRPRRIQDRILLGHGSGGKLSADLLRDVFLPALGQDRSSVLEDQAIVPAPGDERADAARIALTTDAFVVKPLFFPGGDIGQLAVHGTVNDLAVGGATPLYLSAAFILEEGFSTDELSRIVRSMRQAAGAANVQLVTGDTKVVDRGKGDQVFITTSGIGVVPAGRSLSVGNARAGDRVLVSGTLGDHGIAIMSLREGLEFETQLTSDTAPLADLTRTMLDACPRIRCMRDPTRGGLSSSLNEIAEASGVGIRLREAEIPLRREVRAACELLGLDPLYVANEGKLVAVAPAEDAEALLEAMRSHPLGQQAAIIGTVTDDHPGAVVMRSLIGGERLVAMLAGEQLPRIC